MCYFSFFLGFDSIRFDQIRPYLPPGVGERGRGGRRLFGLLLLKHPSDNTSGNAGK